ncbi:hypothetical protein [Pseudonocardia sp. WMMC193]|uniref:DUF7352 domain-containing protein n=1 Tax=Pseudonocardia sp. WMMC193 TaxID=2911965 RepID=UPI001F2B75DA|nr:hypothetical protein [Pseudonocardia sp. WMMC193]MCF7550983.1 hypothetical protein [Pseudonocardia sp. WMMC193]
MSRAIWRFTAPLETETRLRMPVGAEILDVVAARGGTTALEVWAIVDVDAVEELRTLLVYGTGSHLPEQVTAAEHLATLSMAGGRYIFHVFEVPA